MMPPTIAPGDAVTQGCSVGKIEVETAKRQSTGNGAQGQRDEIARIIRQRRLRRVR